MGKQFFPWHRWYLLQFENLLRKVDRRVTLPYWDWSIRSQSLWKTGRKSVWNNHPWGLGENGTGTFNCVDKGPFSKKWWRLAPKSGGGCLRRNFMGGYMSLFFHKFILKNYLMVSVFGWLDSNTLGCCEMGRYY